MDFNNTIKKLNSYGKTTINLGLTRIEKLMDLIGNPQDKIKTIHVAGTNGKGSVCTMLSYILCENSLKTGLFISPDVLNIRERIQINNSLIPENDFASIFEKIHNVSQKLSEKPTYFEILTAMAFYYFFSEKCDIAIIETGLGGRLDSTNIIKKPICSVLTNISFDHTQILGKTLKNISYEKCGIIKSGTPVIVSANQKKIVKSVISDFGSTMNSKITFCDKKNIKRVKIKNINNTRFYYKNNEFQLTLSGIHQLINANTALETVNFLSKKFNISYEKTFIGLKKSYIPARFEVFKTTNDQIFIIDGAHNPSGIKNLSLTLKKYLNKHKLIGICGMLKDKEIKKSLSIILHLFKKVFIVEPCSDRAEKLEKITEISRTFNRNVIPCENLSQAIKFSSETKNFSEITVIFGSLYLAGDFYSQCFNKKTFKKYENS